MRNLARPARRWRRSQRQPQLRKHGRAVVQDDVTRAPLDRERGGAQEEPTRLPGGSRQRIRASGRAVHSQRTNMDPPAGRLTAAPYVLRACHAPLQP